jgi:hypothetical protein
MSVLNFPDLDTLHLALTCGAVPPAVSLTPVVAGFDDDGRVSLKPSASLPRAAQNDLRRLGVQTAKTIPTATTLEFSCWLQLIPLRRGEALVPSTQTPVLFELPKAADLPALVSEMLRLGNDRQAFRWLRDEADGPALLRVIGPPYYSLLRALDREPGSAAPRAYVEQSARVWVEVGHTHPLAEQFKAPDGKLVLMRPPRDWLYLDDAPFRDVYDILEFQLPAARARWREADLHEQLTVPLRLAPCGGQEPAELWVLRERAVETLDEFVRSADDILLNRLSFAVGEGEGQVRVIVLRTRPSKLPPPVLQLPAQEYRKYLKLENLFLPLGWRLHPPLRRDAVRKHLADDPDQVTWLHPHGDGTFTPESLPENVFRPLTDWIDYVLDHDHAALRAWMQSIQFDFDPFICKDEDQPRPDKKKGEEREPRSPRKGTAGPAADAPAASTTKGPARTGKAEDRVAPLPELPKASPDERKRKLAELEKQFLRIEGGLDAPERQALWPELALLNAALPHNQGDAMLCWVHALWEEGPDSARWARGWAWTENKGAGMPGATEIDRVLKSQRRSKADVRLLAATVVAAVSQDPPPEDVLKRLGPVQEFLRQHEPDLPVRAVWLTALALYRLSHGDLLALTRTRDRLLERLFKEGLRAEYDLPEFLRFSGVRSSDRFRAFREWLLVLPDRVTRWLHEVNKNAVGAKAEDTLAYANLMLAYGMARVGEEQRSRELLERGRTALAERDDVHTLLLNGFEFRIKQALDGKPPGGPWPAHLLEYLGQMGQMEETREERSDGRIARYRVEKLREYSRVLEPHEKINAYRRYHVHTGDDLEKRASQLCDLIDRETLERTAVGLIQEAREASPAQRLGRTRVVSACLGVAPRVGERFAKDLLGEVVPACAILEELAEKTDDLTERGRRLNEEAELLEKAIFLAAHFDQAAQVQGFVGHFQALVHKLQKTVGGDKLDSLGAQCLRGLRKLGLRDEIHAILNTMAEVITGGKPLPTLAGKKNWSDRLRTLLHVAAGWYYFDMQDEAKPVMEQARTMLFRGELSSMERARLACAYAATLGQAPVDFSLQCIDELFQALRGVKDTLTTNTHYSLTQLTVIEAVVLAVVTEDFALGTTARRWLDDEEFLIRRRVHGDVHALMGQEMERR